MSLKHLHRYLRAAPLRKWTLPPSLATHNSGGANLEVFKFGMYIMFPIGWMYYFGVNLDTRFAVPDFWPAPETTHKIPFEREELKELGVRLRRERLEKRRRRLEREGLGGGVEGLEDGDGDGDRDGGSGGLERGEGKMGEGVEEVRGRRGKEGEGGMFGVGSIERWARGRWRD